MASVRESRGRLFLDYRLNGKRQRVYVKLADSPANREHLQRVSRQVDATLAVSGDVMALLASLGMLDDADVTSGVAALAGPVAGLKPTVVSFTPTFSAFAEQWFTEFKVGWRRTYVITVRGILDKYLLPRFGALAIGSVTRAQILDLRSSLAAAKGKRAGTKLSPARVRYTLDHVDLRGNNASRKVGQ